MGKNLFILITIAIVGTIISAIFLVVDNVGVLLGWLLGSAVNLFAYISIHKGSAYLLSTSTSSKRGYLTILWGLLRFALYAGCLVLAAFASFRWGSLSHGYCNLISTALALMPTWIVLVIATFVRSNKKPAVENKPVEEPKDGGEENA